MKKHKKESVASVLNRVKKDSLPYKWGVAVVIENTPYPQLFGFYKKEDAENFRDEIYNTVEFQTLSAAFKLHDSKRRRR